MLGIMTWVRCSRNHKNTVAARETYRQAKQHPMAQKTLTTTVTITVTGSAVSKESELASASLVPAALKRDRMRRRSCAAGTLWPSVMPPRRSQLPLTR